MPQILGFAHPLYFHPVLVYLYIFEFSTVESDAFFLLLLLMADIICANSLDSLQQAKGSHLKEGERLVNYANGAKSVAR